MKVQPKRSLKKPVRVVTQIENTGTLTLYQRSGEMEFLSMEGVKVVIANMPTPVPNAMITRIELPYGSRYTTDPKDGSLILTW